MQTLKQNSAYGLKKTISAGKSQAFCIDCISTLVIESGGIYGSVFEAGLRESNPKAGFSLNLFSSQ